jgi:cAMP phosphodiesterase
LRHDPSGREFLFFGDVEPDAIVETPQTINVWRAAAPKIPEILSCIFIECSWASGRKNELLFGHLTPEHLGNELAVLASELVKHRRAVQSESGQTLSRKRRRQSSITAQDLRGALSGVRVYIIHCKEDMNTITTRPTREIILEQCRQVMEEKGLGAEILLAVQGMHIGRRFPHAARHFF